MPSAVVTGTDHGLGRAFVEEFARRGFRVCAGSHALANEGRGSRTISASVTEPPLDVTDPSLVRALAEHVEAHVGSLDVLVNVNGTTHPW